MVCIFELPYKRKNIARDFTPAKALHHTILLNKTYRENFMATLLELSHLYDLTEQLVEKANKQELAETARLLAVNLSHYQMKYGDLLPDEQLAMSDIEKPNAEQTDVLVSSMENLLGVLGDVVMGISDPRQ